ncbi:hypothetical protein [Eubacterium sp. 1001713B170207_170306_E7]|uniref:hypothetical protein n=1 Tax=Eubacterium sp. 1001713B170207_170306_E7 TaxID=2787097 RepID=UPI00189BD1C7|nr:hypothetical protein [Eubacterium sp. 1001713B170207_170306_E7]
MDPTKNLKKLADMTETERTRARKDLRYYPVPDYLKALGALSMVDLTREMPLVYHCDNPFFPIEGGYQAGETPGDLSAGALAGRLGEICRVKLGNSAHPLHLLEAIGDGRPLRECFFPDGSTHLCAQGEIEAEGETPLSMLDIKALKSPRLRAVTDQAFLSDSIDMKRWVYCLRGQWSDRYFVLIEKGEAHE